MEKLSEEYEKIILLLIEEKSYAEIQKELGLRQGQLQLRMRILREMFGVKTSLGLAVKYLKLKSA